MALSSARALSEREGATRASAVADWSRNGANGAEEPWFNAVAGRKVWCVPELTDEYIERMECVLAICERPYDSWDQWSASTRNLSRYATTNALRFGRVTFSLRRDAEYRCCGTANLFGVVEPKGGRHFTRVTKNYDRFEFAKMMRLIERAYPIAQEIHLVLDNASTHSRKAVVDMYGEKEAERI